MSKSPDRTSLFDPLPLRAEVVARNRIWLAPLTNMQSNADGSASDAEVGFLARRAIGGFGLVETCASHVTQDGKGWAGELGCHSAAMVPGLSRVARKIHEGGALASVQLFHGGIRADAAVSGLPRIGPSSAAECGAESGLEPELAITPAREADLERITDAFADAARRCAEAGFDVVELHGAHGYLLSQFLSSTYNRRTDRWGGSLENRARLIRTVVRAVRSAAPSLVLGVRLSPEDFGQAKGLDLDESVQVARWLAEDGMEVLHLSLWRSALNTTKRPDAHAVTLFRDALGPDMRIIAAGQVWTRTDADALLALGADAVALGRAAIGHHDWPRLVRSSNEPSRPPFSVEQLRAQGLSDGFVEYMRKWKGFVA